MTAMDADPQMGDLRRLFLARLRAERTEIEAARTARDAASALPILHRMAGSAGIFGFPDLSRAAGECEDAVRSGAEPDLEDLLRIVDRHLAVD